MTSFSAVDSFSNPGVLLVIAKLRKAEIRLRPFSEPSMLWHPQHPRYLRRWPGCHILVSPWTCRASLLWCPCHFLQACPADIFTAHILGTVTRKNFLNLKDCPPRYFRNFKFFLKELRRSKGRLFSSLINKMTTYTRHLNSRPWANGFYFSMANTTNYEIYEYISSIENSCQLFDWIQMHILSLENKLNQTG